jgi:endo-1,4-beta-D-glucanase Y
MFVFARCLARTGVGRPWPALLIALGCFGCSDTVDVLGYGEVVAPVTLKPIDCSRVASMPNAYRDVLGLTDAQISAKLTNAINTLFHGNQATQSIFTANADTGTAYIRDTLHRDEVRTEGMGLGMLVAVLLDRQSEFDQLWRFSISNLELKTGAAAGYFRSRCDLTEETQRSCIDPFGLQQYVTALLLANQRWGNVDGSPSYGADALHLLTLIRTKMQQNGGIVDGVTNTFDSTAHLPYDEPVNGGLPYLGTALAIPGYYDLWAQVTSDSFYTEAAAASRAFLQRAAHPVTGLFPNAADFDGVAVRGRDNFLAEAYRVHLNIAIDQLWGEPSADDAGWQAPIVDRMLRFFTSKGLDTYSSGYSLDGSVVLKPEHIHELVMANAVIASISSVPNRRDYISAAWLSPPPEGVARYYSGIIYLVGNLILAGRFVPCP